MSICIKMILYPARCVTTTINTYECGETMKIEIYMLGKFMILVNGYDIIKDLGSSKKKIELLQYLILNTGKNVAATDLHDILWMNKDNTNPESSLKTLISRLRASLNEFDLKDAIVTKRGHYTWNENLDAQIDVFDFEALCRELLFAEELSMETEQKLQDILTLYQGDLLPHSSMEHWVAPKSMYYHTLYLDTLHHCVKLLGREERCEDIIRICRSGLTIDAFDSTLNLELMIALLKLGKSKDALAQYNCTTEMHYAYLGMAPSNEILEFYKKLIHIERTSVSDIDAIRQELWEEDEDDQSGAFICEYAIFKDIYKLHMRNLERLGTPMFLSLVTVDYIANTIPDSLLLDKVMKILLATLKQNLRRGDTISRYSPYQYALLLPTVNHQTGQVVLERVKKAFYSESITSQFVMNYKLQPIGQDM